MTRLCALALSATLFCLTAACDRAGERAAEVAPEAAPEASASVAPADATGTAAAPAASPVPASTAMELYDGLSALAVSPAADAPARLADYLDRHFHEMCEADPRFTLDRICQTVSEPADADPSPWPEALLGLQGERVVVAVLTRPDASLGAPWSCSTPSALDPVRLCFLPDAAPADRRRWTAEWARFFQAAD